MPVVLRPAEHPRGRAQDQINTDRIMSLFNKLQERLIVASEIMEDDDLKGAFEDMATRVDAIHHDLAILLF